MAATTITRNEQVLAAVQSNHRATTDLEIERLLLAVEWAELNLGEAPEPGVEWAMHELPLAGEGAPMIDESAAAEFALAVGMKHESGLRYLGDALELHFRLPRIWARVMTGEVPVWKARRIAEATKSLSMDAADAVDQRLAIIAKRCSFAELARQVDKARAEHDPEEAERIRLKEAEHRRVDVHRHGISPDGIVPITGYAGLADALVFDAWLSATAAALDPSIPLDVRRSMALGMVGTSGTGGPAQKELVLYAHSRPGQAMVEVENTRTVVTPEQVREWCEQAGTKVTIRPVIDLNEELSTSSYVPTPVMKEQTRLRHPQCVFVDCEQPARSCDNDHRTPHPIGDTTSTNLFSLCRTHHRFKTTGGWRYITLDHDEIVWVSPMGKVYRRHIP